MSKLKEERLRSIYKVFEELKVFTLGKLVSALSCSIPNARLKLKQWEAHTSYNQNGRCYALLDIVGIFSGRHILNNFQKRFQSFHFIPLC